MVSVTVIEVPSGLTLSPDVVMLESMKMQMYIQSETAGTVKAVKVNAGDFVNEGDPILELE